MKTVRDYYQYRDELRKAVENETNEAMLEEFKAELKIAEDYIVHIEKSEKEDRHNEKGN